MSSLLENDAILWTVTSVLLFAWTAGYWLTYRGGLDTLRNDS